jgi:uncharacterized membrane protein
MSEMNPYKPPESPAADNAAAKAGNFIAAGRAVDASRGWEWIAAGWTLFVQQPFLWVVDGFAFFLVVAVLPYVPPVLGFIVSMVVTPVILGGLMLGSQAVHQGHPLTFGHLFAGFQKNIGALLSAGLVWLVCFVVIGLIGGLVMGVGIFGAISAAMMTGDPVQIMTIIMGSIMTILLGLLVALALLVPVSMALWFAPALIVMHNLGVGAALRSSFIVCLKNAVPFLLYGLIMLVLWFVAAIPLMLGFLVLVPVTIASIYTAYRDIFFAD